MINVSEINIKKDEHYAICHNINGGGNRSYKINNTINRFENKIGSKPSIILL